MPTPPPAPPPTPQNWDQIYRLGATLWLGVSFVTLGGLAVVLAVNKPGHFTPFVTDEMGYRMLVGSVVLLAVYAVAFSLGTAALGRVYRHIPGGPGRLVAQVVWTLLAFTFLCLPVAVVMMVGPAAVKIQENLRTE